MTYVPIDIIVDQRERVRHNIDSLNFLSFDILLILVLLSTLLTKRCKFHFINGTGLAIVFGLILGASISYFGLVVELTSVSLKTNMTGAPQDYVKIEAQRPGENNTHSYVYEFQGELKQDYELGSQISYVSIDPEIFFNILLPPIVLNASFNMPQKYIFMNLGAIFAFAFIGTTISVIIVGLTTFTMIQLLSSFFAIQHLIKDFSLSSCFYFGALISPTDTISVLAIFNEIGVDATLFALIFGESILNDAVSIVLTQSIDLFSLESKQTDSLSIAHIIGSCLFGFVRIFSLSSLIGIFYGIVTALMTKHIELNHTPLFEASLFILISYASFLTAEVFNGSGIVAILLCGITQAQYTFDNLTLQGQQAVKQLFSLMTFLCENFLFLAIGVAFWQQNHTWDFHFMSIAFFSVIFARVCSVYPLTYILNLKRADKIPKNFAHIMTWGGATRGLVSYALAAQNTVGNSRCIIWSTTTALVIFSGVVVGGSTNFILSKCDISNKEERSKINDSVNNQSGKVCAISKAGNPMLNGENLFQIPNELENEEQIDLYAGFVKFWLLIDNRYIRPTLTNNNIA